MKDLGGNGTEESVTTTLGDIELGKIYRLTLYTMTAVTLEDGGAGLNGANNDEYYGGSYKDKFDYQMGKNVGTLYDRQVVSGVTQNKWGITYFIGDPDNIVDGKGRMVLNVFPGEYSAYDGGGSNLTVEILHPAVELNAVEELDSDGDGVADSDDVDDDNDGILDDDELLDLVDGVTIYDPLGDEDGDKLPNYLDVRDDGTGDSSDTDYNDINGDGIPDVFDFDNDGIPNHLDLDSDNDGIPDNIEAQATDSYIAPSGAVGAGFTDVDGDGLDDNYDGTVSGGTPGTDITAVNSDSATVSDNPDYLDLDSDEDGKTDTEEANINLTYNFGTNGLDNAFDNGDGYTDVNGNYDNTPFGEFPNTSAVDSPDDVNWRDIDTALDKDTDGDGIPDSADIDDDNDGILDTEECGTTAEAAAAAFGIEAHFGLGGTEANAITSNNLYANLNDVDDFLVIDLNNDSDVAANTIIKIESSVTTNINHTMRIEESVNGTDFFNQKIYTWTTTGSDEDKEYRLESVARYIRITLEVEDGGSLRIDHVSLDGFKVICDPDGDGIPDNIEAQATADYAPPSGDDNDGDGLDNEYDDTPNGLADGTGSLGISPNNHDTIDTPDYLDTDSDNDGTLDRIEANLSLSGNNGKNGLDANSENSDNYSDPNGSFDDFPFAEFPNNNALDVPNDVDWRDSTAVFTDNDNDGVSDSTDLDDDNDGILDTVESGGFDPLGDDDGDSILNYLDISDDDVGGPATTDYTDDNGDGYPDVYHADSDGVPNHLDIDADNDGIPDNVEAQNTRTTGAGTLYIAPTGIVGTNGFDNAYETALDNGVSIFTPVNTDATHPTESDLIPDYLDTDSDGDLIPDIQENGDSDNAISGTDTDGDGLDDNFEGVDNNDGYDVNDEIDIPQADLPDEDSDVATQDVDYRDTTTETITPGSAGNILWLRADRDVTDNAGIGQEVTSWIDQTNAFDATSATGEAPDKIDNGLNFNPILDFDRANNEDLIITGGILGNSSYNNLWSYVVVNPNTANNSFVFVEGLTNGNFHVKSPTDGLSTIRQRFAASGTNYSSTPTNFLNNYSIYTFGSTNTAAGSPTGLNQANHQLGAVMNSRNTAIVTVTGRNDNFDIGSNGGSGREWDGQIAEIMVFNETPTAAKQQQIESYLAIKYGFTLSAVSYSGDIVEGDYVLADQTTKVWDYTANSAYHNDVAGIGRDDAMDFAQYQSKSVGVSSDAIITIGLTAIADSNVNNVNFATGFDSNKDFLMWGNDDGSVLLGDVTETELICAPEKTLERKWKVVENGSVGTVEITATKSTLDAALTTPNTIKVLKVADDENFTTNVKYAPLKEDGTVYTTEFDFNGTKYFTFSEINGVFWNGGATLEADRWLGGDNSGKPTTNTADLDKVMVIDAQGTDNHPTLTEDAIVECVWIKSGSKLMVEDNKYLEFDEDFILDGEIRLIDNGQLIQTHTGASNVQGNGKLYRDQAAKVPSIYRYHYWSSPVRELNLDSFRVGEVMKDGTNATSETSTITEINWVAGYDGAIETPIEIAPYWIYSYLNGTTQSDWEQKLQTGVLERGQGYTMKSTSANPQNFTFVGTPNDGSITFNFIADKNAESLLGNPYPSALDAVDFIGTNLSAIDGTLYFWEHTGEDDFIATATEGHNLRGYQGGYSQRNISMGIAANSIPTGDTYTFDFEDATDNASNITQTVEGTTITYSTTNSKQNLNTSEDEAANTTGNYLDSDDDIDASFTSTFSFDKDINVQSIYIAKKGAGTLNLTLSTPDGASNDNVLKTLTDTDGVKVNLFWSEIASFTITGDVPLNLIIDDIIFTEGGTITVGQEDYHAPNRYIAVGQGFFVASSATGGTVRFENSMRNFETDVFVDNDGDGTGTYFYKGNNVKANEKDQYDLLPILKLGFNHLGSNNIDLHRQIGISFRNTNSFKYDNGYDSEVYDIGSTDIYWHFPKYSDKKLIIAGVKEINDRLEVPLTIKIGSSKPISIEIDAIKNIDRDIFIEDKLLNMFYPLSKETPIILDLEKGTYSDRFYLTFNNKGNSTLNTEENILNTRLAVFMNNKDNEITIQNLNNLIINKLELFNILGKRINVWNDLKNESQYKFKVQELSSSIYVIKISTEKGVFTKKIIID
ncbi:T9SS type A sorting domain-containing protein [uncultured Polaribacter sp.]|uniref:T9SS type A sorting domain-containing protein n=1 Tax=uncultured Polaribacter sp. TaxID=174711 RepID=UPI0026244BA3|nr:T9SS type A sorting domain-containing protein [uncultured Polaribacter sp.]